MSKHSAKGLDISQVYADYNLPLCPSSADTREITFLRKVIMIDQNQLTHDYFRFPLEGAINKVLSGAHEYAFRQYSVTKTVTGWALTLRVKDKDGKRLFAVGSGYSVQGAKDMLEDFVSKGMWLDDKF